jgi:hypothetical protein
VTATRTWTLVPTVTPTMGPGPGGVAGVALWLDAGRLSGLNNGDAVATWMDGSGNGHEATQGTSTRRPVYVASALNGQPAVRFDGLNDYLGNTSFTILSGQSGATAFVVRRTDTKSGNHMAFGVVQNDVTSQVYDGNTYTHATMGKYGRVSYGSTAWEIAESVFDGSGVGNVQRLKMYLNGSGQGLIYTGTIPAVLSSGVGYEVGRPYGLDLAYWDGDIAEVVVYGRALNEGERLAVQGYLGQKYAIGVVP